MKKTNPQKKVRKIKKKFKIKENKSCEQLIEIFSSKKNSELDVFKR